MQKGDSVPYDITKEQIRQLAKLGGPEVRKELETLYPTVFKITVELTYEELKFLKVLLGYNTTMPEAIREYKDTRFLMDKAYLLQSYASLSSDLYTKIHTSLTRK